MGFLQIDGTEFGGPISDFAQAIFSFWFRVPSASIAAANAQFRSIDPDTVISNNLDNPFWDATLLGMLPLVTFGPNPVATNSIGATSRISPCFIGVNCGPNVQTNYHGDMSASQSLVANFSYDNQGWDFTTDGGTIIHYQNHFEVGYWGGFGTFFEGSATTGSSITVTADRWHHLILSFDFSTRSDCLFYWSFDDVNYSDDYLWPHKTGSQTINSVKAFTAGGSITPENGALQSSTHKYGIPSTDEYVDWVYSVEMAEFQMWVGQSADVSQETVRRLFVDSTGKPVQTYTLPDAEFGSPLIRLAGRSTNWKDGTNAGTGGDLAVVGTISDFTAAPAL